MIASLGFLSLGIFTYSKNPDGLYLFLGLCFGFLGDFFLGCKDIFSKTLMMLLGILTFFIVHILYNIAVIRCLEFSTLYYLIPIIIISVVLIIHLRNFSFSKLKYFVFAYLIISICLAVFSIGNLFKNISLFKLISCVGIILFVTSDYFLCHLYFGKSNNKVLKLLNIGCYYFGQLLIALAIFWY